ncbi:MAG: DUF3472 domain-containing protein, partial [Planctomycetota bacterium]
MQFQTIRFRTCLTWAFAIASIALTGTASTSAKRWEVPLAGNTYDIKGTTNVFFQVDRECTIDLKFKPRAQQSVGPCSVNVTRIGDSDPPAQFDLTNPQPSQSAVPIGTFQVAEQGYICIQILSKSKTPSAENIASILVASSDDDLRLHYVRSNKGGMHYWGRRGPSVHLRYRVPKNVEVEYAYSEITVPKGADPVGSYFMANGFAEGYFGMQVNSPTQRRILFSVWSPYQTDDPRKIPIDQRITMLAKGKDVHVGKFGNEGSGGQSYLVFPWTAGQTYCFLTRVRPQPDTDTTTYTCWFGEKSPSGESNETGASADINWRLIASFRRPKTTTHLRGFHCFLENFSPRMGHVQRNAEYGNVWTISRDGTW